MSLRTGATIAALLLAFVTPVAADGSGDPAAASSSDGEYSDKAGNPTFKIDKDGTVDWYTSVGYIRYTANCMQCHGPDGLGSSFAPSLVDALQNLSYDQFLDTVTNGKKNVSASQDLVMPAFGTNPNVMCYVDAMFVYLRARSDGALGRGNPQKSAAKPAGYAATEDACMG
ncbi:c-type cytochrome, methanol metabolism-related [Ancylobacter amanitiformis]|uniref:Methanol metabolism-related c-type cytochrome n=1 Tax=Ancylobacter amanitiformis TaxID=217069 RepID=A0ABU0LT85_9HYPH|nr:c-type cytochrome, methanol metabolism-related [Ancylobacter amanitiformis]MDQ0511927.1 methanol metabolism-related c-type cytochrome [Ancylobacter amanitiformis]